MLHNNNVGGRPLAFFWNCTKIWLYWENATAVVTKTPALWCILGTLKVLQWEKTSTSKKAVTRNRLNVNTSKKDQWLEIFQDISVMEKLTYLLGVKGNTFKKSYLLLFTTRIFKLYEKWHSSLSFFILFICVTYRICLCWCWCAVLFRALWKLNET